MTFANAKKDINRSNSFSLQEKRTLRAVATELAEDATTNATAIAALNAGSSEAITATVGGGTTGLISASTDMAVVTSAAATSQISLPAAVVGKHLRIYVGANGCELISAVAAHKVNNVVVGATNEAAIPASTLLELDYVAANTWVMRAFNNLGAEITAIVPDAL